MLSIEIMMEEGKRVVREIDEFEYRDKSKTIALNGISRLSGFWCKKEKRHIFSQHCFRFANGWKFSIETVMEEVKTIVIETAESEYPDEWILLAPNWFCGFSVFSCSDQIICL